MTVSDGSDERLVDLLAHWRGAGLTGRASRSALEPRHLRGAASEVVRRLGNLVPRAPRSFELTAIRDEIQRAWLGTRSLDGVAPRILRMAPWVLFLPRNRPASWLAHDGPFLTTWLAWLWANPRSRTVVSLLHEYLAAYPRSIPTFDLIRNSLQTLLDSGAHPRLQIWRDRAQRFELLESDAPSLFSNRWWDDRVSFAEYGASAGIVPGLEASEFVRRATEALSIRIGHALATATPSEGWVSRGLEWLESDGGLRFDDQRIAIATALLSSFGDRHPSPDVQVLLQSFLLRTIGDPRSQRHRWQAVPAGVRNVLLRWLVAGSLEDFFRVLDETAQDSHWRYRKELWWAYHRREVISDAWVVLGRNAARIVRREFDSPMSAGRLISGSGALPAHSVLLMRIGSLTIAEWSHNGKCRIWTQSNRRSPKLYEEEYGRRQLVEGARWEIVHHGSETGRWQSEISKIISDETGIGMQRGEYMRLRRR